MDCCKNLNVKKCKLSNIVFPHATEPSVIVQWTLTVHILNVILTRSPPFNRIVEITLIVVINLSLSLGVYISHVWSVRQLNVLLRPGQYVTHLLIPTTIVHEVDWTQLPKQHHQVLNFLDLYAISFFA